MRLVINPDRSMACAERLPISIVDIARAGSLSSVVGADCDPGAMDGSYLGLPCTIAARCVCTLLHSKVANIAMCAPQCRARTAICVGTPCCMILSQQSWSLPLTAACVAEHCLLMQTPSDKRATVQQPLTSRLASPRLQRL